MAKSTHRESTVVAGKRDTSFSIKEFDESCYVLVRCYDIFKNIKLDLTKKVFCDTETSQHLGKTKEKGGLYGKVRLVQIYQEGWNKCIILDTVFIDLLDILDLLQPTQTVWHNGAYDIHTINANTDELWFPEGYDDTIWLSRLVHYDKTKFTFYDCLDHCELTDSNIDSMDKKVNQKANWGGPLSKEMLLYAAYDVIYLKQLWDAVSVEKEHRVYKLNCEVMKYNAYMAREGNPVNRDVIREMRREQMIRAESALNALPVNPSSPKQVCSWLGITSSASGVLGEMRLTGNQDAATILEARHATKALNFIDKYDADRVYGFHNPEGTVLGRMSCSGGDRHHCENVQQTPHYLYKAMQTTNLPDDMVFVYSDFAGLHIRLVASYTGDPVMCDLLRKGVDVHGKTGCYLFSKTSDTLVRQERRLTKFYNFTMIYGGGIRALMYSIRSKGNVDMPMEKIKELRVKWYDMYKYIKAWHDMHARHLNIYGYIDIETCMGRKIRTYTLNDSLNYIMQGSESEIMKNAINKLWKRYGNPNLVNVVHDSLMLLQPRKEADVWVDRLNEVMTEAWYEGIAEWAVPDLPMPPEAEIKTKW